MEYDQIRDYCLSKKSSSEETPFGPGVLVFKVCGKMFGLISFDEEDGLSMNLKNSPERNIELREAYPFITSGYHMNKDHWNTIHIFDGIDPELLHSLIDQSYESVVSGLPKKVKATLV